PQATRVATMAMGVAYFQMLRTLDRSSPLTDEPPHDPKPSASPENSQRPEYSSRPGLVRPGSIDDVSDHPHNCEEPAACVHCLFSSLGSRDHLSVTVNGRVREWRGDGVHHVSGRSRANPFRDVLRVDDVKAARVCLYLNPEVSEYRCVVLPVARNPHIPQAL